MIELKKNNNQNNKDQIRQIKKLKEVEIKKKIYL
jgi:hypothetical protein